MKSQEKFYKIYIVTFFAKCYTEKNM